MLDNAVIYSVCDFDAALFGKPDPWVDLGVAGDKPELDLEWVKMTLEKEDDALWLHVVMTEREGTEPYGSGNKGGGSYPEC